MALTCGPCSGRMPQHFPALPPHLPPVLLFPGHPSALCYPPTLSLQTWSKACLLRGASHPKLPADLGAEDTGTGHSISSQLPVSNSDGRLHTGSGPWNLGTIHSGQPFYGKSNEKGIKGRWFGRGFLTFAVFIFTGDSDQDLLCRLA